MPQHRRKPAFEGEADGAVAYYVPGEMRHCGESYRKQGRGFTFYGTDAFEGDMVRYPSDRFKVPSSQLFCDFNVARLPRRL